MAILEPNLVDESKATYCESVQCPICEVDDTTLLYKEGVAQPGRIVRCNRCDLMYVNPRVRLVDSKDYERWDAEDLLKGVATDPEHRSRSRYEKERLQVADYWGTRARLRELFPKRGNLLEVGSGLGFLLAEFRKDGWNVLGIDPWKEVVPFTRREHCIKTLPFALEEADFQENSFDVIVMLHVIEHVTNPLESLSIVYRLLKPGGYFVLETPRFNTLSFRILGPRERSIRCAGHVYFFTDQTLARCYERVGFQLVEHAATGRSFTMDRMLWNLMTIGGRPRLARAAGRLSHWLNLSRLRLSLNLRDIQRVLLQKPNESTGPVPCPAHNNRI